MKPKPNQYDIAEYADSDGIYQRFGIKRSLLYQLHWDRLIKSVTLQQKGTKRGKRLWHIASIRQYLESLIEENLKQ